MKIYIHVCDQCGKRDCTYGTEFPRPNWWTLLKLPAGERMFCRHECLRKYLGDE